MGAKKNYIAIFLDQHFSFSQIVLKVDLFAWKLNNKFISTLRGLKRIFTHKIRHKPYLVDHGSHHTFIYSFVSWIGIGGFKREKNMFQEWVNVCNIVLFMLIEGVSKENDVSVKRAIDYKLFFPWLFWLRFSPFLIRPYLSFSQSTSHLLPTVSIRMLPINFPCGNSNSMS